MKANELRKKSETELVKMLQDKKAKTVSLKMNIASGNVKNVSEVQDTKRDIARINTILRERETAENASDKKEADANE